MQMPAHPPLVSINVFKYRLQAKVCCQMTCTDPASKRYQGEAGDDDAAFGSCANTSRPLHRWGNERHEIHPRRFHAHHVRRINKVGHTFDADIAPSATTKKTKLRSVAQMTKGLFNLPVGDIADPDRNLLVDFGDTSGNRDARQRNH